jgi:ATP-binding cassette subfamily B protein
VADPRHRRVPRHGRRPPRALRRLGVLFGVAWRADPLLLTGCVVVALVGAALGLAYPVAFGLIVDGATQGRAATAITGVAITAVAVPGYWGLRVIGSSLGSKLTDQANLRLGLRIGSLVNTAPFLEHFERPEHLAEIDTLRERRRVLAAAPTQCLNLLSTGLQFAGAALLLALIWPPLLLMPLLAAVPGLAQRQAGQIQKRNDDELAGSRRLANELFTLASTPGPARELRTFGVTGALLDRHARLGDETSAQALRAARRAAAWQVAGWLVYAAGFAAAIILLVLRAVHGDTSTGSVVEAISLLRRAQRQVSGTTTNGGSFATAAVTADRLLWLEDYVESAIAAGTRPVPTRLREGIRLDHVGFTYPDRPDPTLQDVDLLLPAGATVALIGENGAGKSTLIKLLTGMYRPSSGAITVDGTDLAAIEPARWRAATTAAFQDFVQFHTTISDGVGVGDLPRLGDRDAVTTALRRADAGALIDKFPDGLDTLLGPWVGGRSLSTGQWQRLALARGLMRRKPLLVVLDEPTSSLDAPSEAELFARYHDAARRLGQANGTITILVSHRFSSVHMADQIIVMDQGRIAETGSHDKLLRRDGIYAELFALQADNYLGHSRPPAAARAAVVRTPGTGGPPAPGGGRRPMGPGRAC